MYQPILPDLVASDLFLHLRGLVNSPYIHAFFWLMWVDIITGYVKVMKTKTFDSKTGTLGMLRHILVFATITIVATYSRALGVRPFGIAWVMFFNFNYLGSIVENWEVIGLGFPEFLKPYINQKKKKANQLAQSLVEANLTIADKGENIDGNSTGRG